MTPHDIFQRYSEEELQEKAKELVDSGELKDEIKHYETVLGSVNEALFQYAKENAIEGPQCRLFLAAAGKALAILQGRYLAMALGSANGSYERNKRIKQKASELAHEQMKVLIRQIAKVMAEEEPEDE